jgi:hypothetical protein
MVELEVKFKFKVKCKEFSPGNALERMGTTTVHRTQRLGREHETPR